MQGYITLGAKVIRRSMSERVHAIYTTERARRAAEVAQARGIGQRRREEAPSRAAT